MRRFRKTHVLFVVGSVIGSLALAACGSGGGSGDGTTLTFATSYTPQQPQDACGADVIADRVNKANVGIKIKVYPNSQLGGDTDRVASDQSGDIDMDLQGAAALGQIYKPIAAVDAAYAFENSEQLRHFFDSSASEDLRKGFEAKTGIHILGAWNTGLRDFTANKPIRKPSDLKGLRMRFPDSPMYLMNAKALGAHATEVAYEELFLSLQQGVVDGQENPITNIAASHLTEVQKYLSLSGHQTSSNVIIIGKVWKTLTKKQQKAINDAVAVAERKEPACVAKEEKKTLDKWRSDGSIKIVDDVDKAAFAEKARAYLKEHLPAEQAKVYEAILSSHQ